MLTIIENGTRVIDPHIELLDDNQFKHAYTTQIFDELGVLNTEEKKPISSTSPWYCRGEIHGIPVMATFNSFENLSYSVFGKTISYKSSMKETLNKFMDIYRNEWHEHNDKRKRDKNNL